LPQPWVSPWEISKMINLIPKEEKKKMMQGFYCRLVVLFLAILAVCTLIALVAILPSYFLVSIKNNLAESKLASQRQESVPLLDQQASALISDINSKLKLVQDAEQDKFDISQRVINEVLSKKTSDIKITQIMYQNSEDPTVASQISVRGTAASRESLLLFSQTLQADAAFKSVDLPIANFVKGSNIQFYLNIIPSQPSR
jgi:hypothetical protein